MKKNLYEKPSVGDFAMQIDESILSISVQGNTIDDATIDSWEDEL